MKMVLNDSYIFTKPALFLFFFRVLGAPEKSSKFDPVRTEIFDIEYELGQEKNDLVCYLFFS